MSANTVAAEILDTSAQAFARQSNVRFHEYLADSDLELTENPPAWQGHFQQRIIELAAALRVGQPGLFVDKILWLQKAYSARGISANIPKAVLASISETVADALPRDAAAAVSKFIAAASAALDAPAGSEPAESSLNPQNSPDNFALRFIAACMDGQTEDAKTLILDAIADGMAPRDAIVDVLLSAEREIGDLWHRNDASISQEHLVTNTTIELLALIGRNFAPRQRTGRKALIASVSGNAHDIGLRATDVLFRLEGWQTYYLGTDLPPNEIAASADYFDVDIVVLSATISTQVDAVIRTINGLRRTAVDPAIIVGGAVFESAPDLWQHVGADAPCPHINDVVVTAEKLLENSGSDSHG